MTDQKVDAALFLWLLLASLLGVLAGLPWTLAVLRDHPGTGWWWEAAGSLLFLVPASAAGVWLGKKVGLGSGLRELVSRAPGCWTHVRGAVLPGMVVGVTIGLGGLIGQSSIPKDALISGLSNPNLLEWTLRCFSAAVTEEIGFRFGLMTLLVWVMSAIVRMPPGHASSLWLGNLLANLLFAAAHLPQLASHSLPLLIATMVSSTGVGLIMGWVFMRYGLIAAILSHLVCDLMSHVVPRVLVGGA